MVSHRGERKTRVTGYEAQVSKRKSRPFSPPRYPLRPNFHRERDVWVRGSIGTCTMFQSVTKYFLAPMGLYNWWFQYCWTIPGKKKNDTLIQFLFSFAEENSSPRMIPDFWLYGDMKLTYHQEALLDLPSSQDNLSIPPKAPAATREKTLLWDNGIIPYVFDCSLGNLEKLEWGPVRTTMKIEFGVLLSPIFRFWSSNWGMT